MCHKKTNFISFLSLTVGRNFFLSDISVGFDVDADRWKIATECIWNMSVYFVIGLHYSIITCQFSMFDVENDIFDMRIFSVCVRRIGVTFNSLVSSVTEIDSKDTIFEVV